MVQPKNDQLGEALFSAFDEKSFETLLFEKLNKRVFDVIPYQDFAKQVTEAAARDGWTNDLINAALRSSPRNTRLLDAALVDPLRRLITEPPDSSAAAGSEIEPGLRALIEILNQSDLNKSQFLFGEIHEHLTDLYSEYQKHAAATTAD